MKLFTLAVAFTGLLALPADSQRIPPRVPPPRPPIPRPIRPWKAGLASVSLHASIRDGAARTEVRAVFENPSRRDAEAEWVVPLPPGAVVHQAKLMVNGKEMKAEILGADKARRTYQAIVARLMDPMLLEYAGWGLVRARIYPIPAGGKARIEFTMTALLGEEGGKWEYTFPFKALTAGGPPPKSLSAQVEIRTSKAMGVVYSPTPGTEIRRKGETRALLGWETKGKQPTDLKLFYSLAEKEFGALALFYSPKGGKGTFFLALSPRRDPAEAVQVPKTVVFVVDTSGSMQGKKIEQVKGALRFFLGSLHEGDAFNVVPFSTEARPLFPEPKPLNAETRKKALEMVEKIEAVGGTNIDDALLRGLRMPDDKRMHILLFLTDGLPTVGETEPSVILRHLKEAHEGNTRIFVFGVGSDVNTFLLDRIAETGRGDRHYVGENEDIEVKVSSLLQRLSRPALSDLALAVEGAEISKLTPSPLPDLFFGSTLTVLGLFEGKGPRDLVVKGRILGKEKVWRYRVSLPEGPAPELSWLAPLWAQRRVAHLLDQIRLYGKSKELVDEVVRLGKEYGIVTPWTSYLVAEEAKRLAEGASIPVPLPGRRGGGYMGPADNAGPAAPAGAPAQKGGIPAPGLAAGINGRGPTTGKKAVEKSRKLARMKSLTFDSDDLDNARTGALGGIRVRRAGGKVFFLLGGTWVDREFKKEMESKIQKVKAFSRAYFQLLQDHPEAAPWLALGSKVLVVIDRTPYLIG